MEKNPCVELQCGHYFHRHCVADSILQKEECPVCRSEHFNRIKVFCEKCFEWYYEDSLLDVATSLPEKKPICATCKKEQERKY